MFQIRSTIANHILTQVVFGQEHGVTKAMILKYHNTGTWQVPSSNIQMQREDAHSA